MTLEALSGPRQLAIMAGRLEKCPHMAGSTEAAEDMSGSSFSADRLLEFAGIKVITDEMAVRLPHAKANFPTQGLPEPGKEQEDEGDTPLKRTLFRLNKAYGTKLKNHIDNELEIMAEDPRFRPIIEANPKIDTSIKGGASNDVSAITGLFSIMPDLVGEGAKHSEIIAIGRNSQRLPILPSLLSRTELDAFRFAATEGAAWPLQPWGFEFNPNLFATYIDKRTEKTYIDYAGGISSLDLKAYWKWVDAWAEQQLASMSATAQSGRLSKEELEAYRPKQLGDFKKGYSNPLTCPARKLILATWADMLDIADRERIFEPSAEEATVVAV